MKFLFLCLLFISTFFVATLSHSLEGDSTPAAEEDAAATVNGVFYGKMGKVEFHMVLNMKSAKRIRGRYNFFKKSKDIQLWGRLVGETLLLEEREKDNFTGIWELKIEKREDSRITFSEGTWYSPDRKTKIKVRISPVGLEGRGDDQAVYESLKPNSTSEETEIRKGATIIKTERIRPGSQQLKFVLKKYRSKDKISKINEFFREWSVIDCSDSEDPDTSWDAGIDSEIEASLWKEDLVQLRRVAKGYCPSSSHSLSGENESLVYDLSTQKTIAFPDLFKDWAKDKSIIIKALFARQIEEYEKYQSTVKITGNDMDNVGCEGAQSLQEFIQAADSGIEFEINFREKKLKVIRKYSNVSNLCSNNEAEVPFKKLEQQLKPEYLKE